MTTDTWTKDIFTLYQQIAKAYALLRGIQTALEMKVRDRNFLFDELMRVRGILVELNGAEALEQGDMKIEQVEDLLDIVRRRFESIIELVMPEALEDQAISVDAPQECRPPLIDSIGLIDTLKKHPTFTPYNI